MSLSKFASRTLHFPPGAFNAFLEATSKNAKSVEDFVKLLMVAPGDGVEIQMGETNVPPANAVSLEEALCDIPLGTEQTELPKIPRKLGQNHTRNSSEFAKDSTNPRKRCRSAPARGYFNGTLLKPTHVPNVFLIHCVAEDTNLDVYVFRSTKGGDEVYHYIGQLLETGYIEPNPEPYVRELVVNKLPWVSFKTYREDGARLFLFKNDLAPLPVRYVGADGNVVQHIDPKDALYEKGLRFKTTKKRAVSTDEESDIDLFKRNK